MENEVARRRMRTPGRRLARRDATQRTIRNRGLRQTFTQTFCTTLSSPLWGFEK